MKNLLFIIIIAGACFGCSNSSNTNSTYDSTTIGSDTVAPGTGADTSTTNRMNVDSMGKVDTMRRSDSAKH